METDVEGAVLVNTSIATEQEIERKEICTEFRSTSIEMSSEYCIESANSDVVFEIERDMVDFSASVECKSIEVGSGTFGQTLIDTLTTHDAKVQIEDSCCEIVCNMVDSESHFEIIFENEVQSQEGVKVCDECMEVKSTTVESSGECNVKLIETGMDVSKTTSDIGTETTELQIVEISSSYEISCSSIDCERIEEEIVMVDVEKEEDIPEITRTEDELICCTVSMKDMSTIVECNVTESSVVMEVRFVEESSEWVETIERIDVETATEKKETANVLISSDVEYCTIDVQVEETKQRTSDSTFETKPMTIENFSTFEVLYYYFYAYLCLTPKKFKFHFFSLFYII